ncbi:TPA: recombination protein NinG [Pseudomonas aeruginosa]|uniref:recombination protein NinG n=1 Tax=Pseudomonas aeruginosa TaxID=287 RepID=UPI001C3EDA56|nr:recombination protein NinG [Pseudomonas aeruginosa]MBV5565665.1 recombination protein NinG [Pseudomonas aeruginosa]MCS7921234.1 recombination protein NinG [Pseudomonas aeruginosa]MCW5358162.1 recombination protein NinG [Pseudomonas aeruginosa]
MSLSASQPKPKKCQNPECGAAFVPQRLGQRVCSPACALAIKDKHAKPARKAIADRERREIKVRKERLKSKADHLREAQAAFNEFIRLRDADQPCISCGRHHDGQYHAGHYRSVGSHPELRFDEDNVHKQCAPCNNHKSGDVVNYRINLVAKIGAAAVARLEGPHDARKWTVEEIKAIKALYRAKARDAKRAAA